MKRLLILLIIYSILLGRELYSQPNRSYETNPDRKRASNWLFGDSIWLDFKSNPPLLKSGCQLKFIESATTFSDTSGKLILYTDGMKLYNGKHHLLANDLYGHFSSSMGSIFVKYPENDSLLYLFTTDYQGNNKGLRYSLLKLSDDVDSIKFIQKNILLVTPVCESISITQHKNNIFTWVIVHSSIGNTFYSFLISNEGINICPTVSNSGYIFDGQALNCQSEMAVSSTNKNIAISILSDFKVQLNDFNSESGKINNDILFNSIAIPTGLAFSNNGKYLYIKERDRNLIRYDITDHFLNTVYTSPKNEQIIDIRNTPNGYIYCNILDSFVGSLIINPDSVGLNFSYNRIGIKLNNKSTNGLPNFNQSYFHTPSIDFAYKFDCTNNEIAFEGRDTFFSTAHNWQIYKKGKPIEGNYTLKNINHTFSDTGIYVVQYIAINGTRSDTIKKEIKIYPKINKHFLGKDTFYGKGTNINKTLVAPFGMQCYFWYTDSSKGNNFLAHTAGVYVAKITNQAFCVVTDTITITECINDLAIPSIFRSGDTLYTYHQTADSFVWHRNEKQYKVTKDPFMKLSDTGTFRVEAAKKGHCNRSSVNQNVNKLNIQLMHLKSTNVNIYPNPANDQMKVELLRPGNYKIAIYNSIGELIYINETQINTLIDLKQLSKGVYLIQITNTENHQLITTILKE